MEGFIRQLLTLPQVQELTAGINGRGNGSCGLRRRTAASGSTGGCGLCTGWRRKRPT